jgi:hypothetical protein
VAEIDLDAHREVVMYEGMELESDNDTPFNSLLGDCGKNGRTAVESRNMSAHRSGSVDRRN